MGGGTFAFAALSKKTVNKIANRDANNVFGSRIESASVANATNATNLAAPEPVHPIGATGEPQFLNGAANFTPTTTPAGFYKDRQCVVHLQGTITATSDTNVFRLPAGDRPPQDVLAGIAVSGPKAGLVQVFGNGDVHPTAAGGGSVIFGLDGVSFRAARC